MHSFVMMLLPLPQPQPTMLLLLLPLPPCQSLGTLTQNITVANAFVSRAVLDQVAS